MFKQFWLKDRKEVLVQKTVREQVVGPKARIAGGEVDEENLENEFGWE